MRHVLLPQHFDHLQAAIRHSLADFVIFSAASMMQEYIDWQPFLTQSRLHYRPTQDGQIETVHFQYIVSIQPFSVQDKKLSCRRVTARRCLR